jgi:hypothetical protein
MTSNRTHSSRSFVGAALAMLLVAACSSGDSGDATAQGSAAARSSPPASAAPSSPSASPPVVMPAIATNDAGADACGNGLDDNGNGAADEGCTCAPGTTQKCFLGDPKLAGVGACTLGIQNCVGTSSSEFESNTWGPCTGSGAPNAETCNAVDDDCNGKLDDVGDGGSCVTGPPCQGTGLIFASVGDECIDDGGGSATGDVLQVYCVNDIARFCLSGEACPWRDGQVTADSVTCSSAGLASTYFASARDACGDWEGHPRICCSASGEVSFTGC